MRGRGLVGVRDRERRQRRLYRSCQAETPVVVSAGLGARSVVAAAAAVMDEVPMIQASTLPVRARS